jgi:ubiquinone/menaquinone biosynthesis C-methylase UbiE
MSFEAGEEKRIRSIYSQRDDISPWNDRFKNIYHPRHPIGEMFYEHNRHVLVKALNSLDIELPGMKILDVGCGYGNWLRNFVDFGADAENCFGVDLSLSRIEFARQKNGLINFQEQSIFSLPFQDCDFDFVFQSVVFSSILDKTSRKAGALEMVRVLNNNGWLMWLDIKQTRSSEVHAFSTSEVCELFPGLQLVYKRHVHPAYFRTINGWLAPLSRLVSEICDFANESSILIFRKLK